MSRILYPDLTCIWDRIFGEPPHHPSSTVSTFTFAIYQILQMLYIQLLSLLSLVLYIQLLLIVPLLGWVLCIKLLPLHGWVLYVPLLTRLGWVLCGCCMFLEYRWLKSKLSVYVAHILISHKLNWVDLHEMFRKVNLGLCTCVYKCYINWMVIQHPVVCRSSLVYLQARAFDLSAV